MSYQTETKNITPLKRWGSDPRRFKGVMYYFLILLHRYCSMEEQCVLNAVYGSVWSVLDSITFCDPVCV